MEKFTSLKKYVPTNEILEATTNLLKEKNVKLGRIKEIKAIYYLTGKIDLTIDNISYTKAGDIDNKIIKRQVKGQHCEIKILKTINEVATNKEEVIDIYLKYNKANRFCYFITIDNIDYIITMNKQQFKNFVMRFGTYSKTRNNIRIHNSDKRIYKWFIEE